MKPVLRNLNSNLPDPQKRKSKKDVEYPLVVDVFDLSADTSKESKQLKTYSKKTSGQLRTKEKEFYTSLSPPKSVSTSLVTIFLF